MKTFVTTLVLLVGVSAFGAAMKISDYPNTSTLASNLLFIVADPGATNRNVAWGQMTNLLMAAAVQTNHAAVTTLDMRPPWQAVTTNNNILYAGFTGVDGRFTNVLRTIVMVTNTSGSLKTVTFTGCIGDPLYVTNQSMFEVILFPGHGTNVRGSPLN